MENITLVNEFLGGFPSVGAPSTDLDFVPLLREGLPYSVFANLRERVQLSDDELCEYLGIAKRTAARRKQDSARLRPHESELVLRLARLFVAAEDTLGSKEKARAWMLAENRALGGRRPISLLDTGIGFEQALDAIGRVEHGVFS